jgi:Mg-chelatase subunit ChlD
VDWQVPYGLSLAVRLALPGGLVRVESPSHPIRVTWQDTQATVTLAHEEVALDRDFVLTAEASGLDSPRAWVEQDDDGRHAIALAFRPRLPVATVPAEILFVVDRSGSMGGPSIDEVRKALGLCLRSMTPGCKFNIVGFGSSFEALFPSSRSYDDASLRAASAHVGSLQADLGGTEILEPLRFALESPRDHGLTRQIVVLTDGQVTNTDAVLALVAEHSGEARIFTFGIGHGASHHLVRGLARAAGGHAEHISPASGLSRRCCASSPGSCRRP